MRGGRRRRPLPPGAALGAAAAATAALFAAAVFAAAVFAAGAAAGDAYRGHADGPRAAAEEGPPARADPRGEPPAGGASRWRFLGGVGAGDYYEYRVCDSLYGPPLYGPPLKQGAAVAPAWTCYGAALHIEAVVPLAGGRGEGGGGGADVYVVRAAADMGGEAKGAGAAGRDAVLLVFDGGEGRLAVRHAVPGDRPLAESLQRTVFWRGGLGGGFDLAYGEPVAEIVAGVRSTALLVSGSRVSAAGGAVEYVALHGPPRPAWAPLPSFPAEWGAGGSGRAPGQAMSMLAVSEGIGLPVAARVYGGAPPPLDHYYHGRPLFEYELVASGRAAERGPQENEGGGPAGAEGPPRAGGGDGGEGAGGPIANPHYTVHGGPPGAPAEGGRR